LALIIGIVAGVLGLVAIIGFLVYYVMKQKRMMAERLAEEEADEDEDAVQEFRSAKRKPNSRKRRI
jgi:bacteriorhodopsin